MNQWTQVFEVSQITPHELVVEMVQYPCALCHFPVYIYQFKHPWHPGKVHLCPVHCRVLEITTFSNHISTQATHIFKPDPNCGYAIPTHAWFICLLQIFYPITIAGQSMWIGRATTLAEAGTCPALIQAAGRWSLDTFNCYVQKYHLPLLEFHIGPSLWLPWLDITILLLCFLSYNPINCNSVPHHSLCNFPTKTPSLLSLSIIIAL